MVQGEMMEAWVRGRQWRWTGVPVEGSLGTGANKGWRN